MADIKNLLQSVEAALDTILLAKNCKNRQMRENQTRIAKSKAMEMLKQIKDDLIELLDESNDDFLSWGFLERDLQRAYEKLKEMDKTD